MENAIQYIDENINRFKFNLEEIKTKLNENGFQYLLSQKAYDAFKNEWLLNVFENLKNLFTECKENKEGLKIYLENEISRYENIRLYGKVMPYSTNPMSNITSIWTFECISQLIQMLTIIKNRIVL